MPIRAVLSDLGNTLVSYYRVDEFAAILRQCLRQCLAELTSNVSVEPDADLFNLALALNQEAPDHAVRPLTERLGEIFPEYRADALALERLSAALLRPIFPTASIDPNAIPVLEVLRALGYSLAIVSNTPWGSSAATWREEVHRHGLLTAIDATVFCCDTGFRKPHPAPILRALEALNVNADHAIFIGDDAKWDVIGARAAGVRPLLLLPSRGNISCDAVPIVHSLKDVPEYIATVD